MLQYRNANGVSGRITLGKLGVLTPDEARKRAKAQLADVAAGHDPAHDRAESRKTVTVAELAKLYQTEGLAEKPNKKASSWRTDHSNSPATGTREGHYTGLQKAWGKIRERAGMCGVRLHDLRHSFASFAVADGATLFMVGRVLGHKQARTTEGYAHLTDDPLRAVADRAANRIAGAMNGVTEGGA